MKKYIQYLRYVIKHKWFVLQECYKVGLYWRGITHDMSKFRPSEFIPYARYFYGNYPTDEECRQAYRCNVSLGKSKEQIEHEFNIAWLEHIHRNKHHWQYWILREDSGKTIEMGMNIKNIKEMICDWRGAGRAIHGVDETKNWYKKNRDNMKLNESTRKIVDIVLVK